MLNRLFPTKKRPYIPGKNIQEPVKIDLSGSVLTMGVLPHSNSEGFPADPIPDFVNIYDDDLYGAQDHLPEWKRSGSFFNNLHKRYWEFKGPFWRNRPFGFIAFRIHLGRVTLPETMSCFNPAHFEQVAIRNAYFVCAGNPDSAEKCGPMNWQLISQASGQTGIYFETHRAFNLRPMHDDSERAYRHHSAMIPIDDHYYLDLSFDYFGYSPSEDCLAVMNPIRDKVINSLQLELGAGALERLQQAKQRWPNAKANPRRKPEPWVYPEYRYGQSSEGEDRIVITKPGSPKPEFIP